MAKKTASPSPIKSQHGPISVNVGDHARSELKTLAVQSQMTLSEYMREIAHFAVEKRITFTKKAIANFEMPKAPGAQ